MNRSNQSFNTNNTNEATFDSIASDFQKLHDMIGKGSKKAKYLDSLLKTMREKFLVICELSASNNDNKPNRLSKEDQQKYNEMKEANELLDRCNSIAKYHERLKQSTAENEQRLEEILRHKKFLGQKSNTISETANQIG
ncbi:MAG: hypothetical protein MHMPM18_003790 [Marteilia pararefringens]